MMQKNSQPTRTLSKHSSKISMSYNPLNTSLSQVGLVLSYICESFLITNFKEEMSEQLAYDDVKTAAIRRVCAPHLLISNG